VTASAIPAARRRYQRCKRAADVILVLLVGPLVLPVALLCVLAVRLDSPGPILFVQERTGRDGRRFRMLKFRTMVRDAEERKASIAHLNVLPPPDFKVMEDPRITRVGRLLRRTSLDELPQLINVLKGDMTLVGPRPTSFSADQYSLWHSTRLEVTPGITGLWQVKARNESSFDERLRLDIQYIRGMSPWLDLKILWWTVAAVVRRSGV